MGAVVIKNPFRWADPSTWPWFVYVELAVIAAGFAKPIWRWIQRSRAERWPITTGKIESVSVNEAKQFFSSSKLPQSLPTWSSPTYVAELGYSYSLAGKVEAGIDKREFGAEEEAWEFLRDLKGKPVLVHYNPDKPSTSTLSKASVETLLQTRAPRPSEVFASLLADSVPQWLKPLLWMFIGLSAVGLVLSLWVHVGAVMGRRVAPEPFFWILHLGIFVVWFPVVFITQRRVGKVRRKDFWKVVLKGSPEWMRYVVYGFLGYAVVNFSLFMAQAPTGGSGADQPIITWRGFSGHWMAFYSAALAILYSAAMESKNAQRCVNGHPVVPNASFCQRCGQPVIHL
jgi:hypothetical protein